MPLRCCKVAIKLVRDLSDESPHTVARVKQEAQAMARVSHPNVVHVYEAGEASGRVFIAMQFVDGSSLAEWQRGRDRDAPGEVLLRLRVYLQAAAGLVAAHACGLIHRDFKPDNVLVGRDGRVCVADFGLARLLAGLTSPAADIVDATPLADEARPSRDSGRRLTQAGAMLVYAPFIMLRPDLRVVLYNALLVAVTVASVYLHMRQAGDAAGDASDA